MKSNIFKGILFIMLLGHSVFSYSGNSNYNFNSEGLNDEFIDDYKNCFEIIADRTVENVEGAEESVWRGLQKVFRPTFNLARLAFDEEMTYERYVKESRPLSNYIVHELPETVINYFTQEVPNDYSNGTLFEDEKKFFAKGIDPLKSMYHHWQNRRSDDLQLRCESIAGLMSIIAVGRTRALPAPTIKKQRKYQDKGIAERGEDPFKNLREQRGIQGQQKVTSQDLSSSRSSRRHSASTRQRQSYDDLNNPTGLTHNANDFSTNNTNFGYSRSSESVESPSTQSTTPTSSPDSGTTGGSID